MQLSRRILEASKKAGSITPPGLYPFPDRKAFIQTLDCKIPPDVLMLCALADYFNVTTDELMGRAKTLHFAVIAAETPVLGQKAAAIAREYGIVARSIHTDFEEAKAAAAEDEMVKYLIACYTSGFYGDCADAATLVSVAPTEEEILHNLCDVFEKYIQN